MAIDGYVIHVDMKPIGEMISLLRRSSNNLNQLAKSCHSYQPFLQQDMDQLQEQYHQLWAMMRSLLGQFSLLP